MSGKVGKPRLSPEEVDKLSERLANAYTSTYEKYSKTEPLSEQQVFAELYNDIVLNSPAIHTILGVEHSYSIALREAQERKARDVSEKTENCMNQLEQIKTDAEKNNTPLSDDQINRLYATHFEDLEFLESTWESELSLMRDTQKNEFREWLNTVSEDIHSSETEVVYSTDSSTKLSQVSKNSEPDLEESFTIYLGTQLKTMHNIRLLVMDPIDLCRSTVDESEGSFSRDPKRMQTALTLYSNNISALVIVVGNRVRDNSDFKLALHDICSKNCEFHFPDLDQQLNSIQEDVITINCQRLSSLGGVGGGSPSNSSIGAVPSTVVAHTEMPSNGAPTNTNTNSVSNELNLPNTSNSCSDSTSDQMSLSSLSQSGGATTAHAGGACLPNSSSSHVNLTPSHSLLSQMSPQNQRKYKALAPGDVYITRHSNLSAVHAILHLVGDSKVMDTFDMNSQHATFVGLKNIFRFAIDFDIINIYIPLLLTDTLSDDKTFENCVKRAELVFKCVKGFMIEATTWTTTKSRTLQFLLPRKESLLLSCSTS